MSSIVKIETGFLSLYLSCVFPTFCLVSFGKTIFVLWLFIRRIPVIFPSYFRGISIEFPAEFPLHVTMVGTFIWLKRYHLGFVFLDKGVGFESSEKLMKGLADLNSRLGRPKKQPFLIDLYTWLYAYPSSD